MFNGKGYNLSDIAAVTGRNGDGMFGDNGWWIILLFLFAGWGRGGFGGFGGGVEGIPATQADVRAAVDQQTLISKLDNQTYGLADSTYALNNAITNGFHGVDNALCTLGYNMQAGMNGISHQISDCCCETGRAIERGFAETNYNLATQACDTRRAIEDSTRSILDFLTQDKIATLQAENQGLRFAASQAAQNAYLVSELRPCPVPAYTVPNPYCCNTYYGGCGAF
ncbi:MAG: hypothetical protein IJ341_10540 [Bacteroidales bacterium]|nr:hypothetical protein [Bacteroidales bacterium]